MLRTASIEKIIGNTMLIGTLIASLLVLIGGVLYLIQYGHENIQYELLHSVSMRHSINNIWQTAISGTPLGLVQLGLLILIGTQFLRVILLFLFYLVSGDIWFSVICGIVSLALTYSLFTHH